MVNVRKYIPVPWIVWGCSEKTNLPETNPASLKLKMDGTGYPASTNGSHTKSPQKCRYLKFRSFISPPKSKAFPRSPTMKGFPFTACSVCVPKVCVEATLLGGSSHLVSG